MSTNPITRPVVRYHGGKFRLAPRLIEIFPPHRVYLMRVIFSSSAQYVICEHCGAYAGPAELLPITEFLIAAKPFVKEHRFCESARPASPLDKRASLGPTHSFPGRHRASWEPREPGEEG